MSADIMSGQHTQGRVMAGTMLVTIGGEQGNFHCVGIEDTNKAIALTGHVSGDPENSDEQSAADARRLAACWNACEGLSTDGVEKIAESGNMFDLGGDLLSAWHELAAACALLSDLNAMDNCDGIARTCTGEACTSYGFQDFMVRVDAFLKGKPVAPQAPAPDQLAAAMAKVDGAVALLRDILKADDEARAALVALGMGPDVSTSDAMALTERIRALLKGGAA